MDGYNQSQTWGIGELMGLLREAEMPQRQVYHQKSIPAWVTDHESQESRQPHCTISGLKDGLILATGLV